MIVIGIGSLAVGFWMAGWLSGFKRGHRDGMIYQSRLDAVKLRAAGKAYDGSEA